MESQDQRFSGFVEQGASRNNYPFYYTCEWRINGDSTIDFKTPWFQVSTVGVQCSGYTEVNGIDSGGGSPFS